MMLAGLLLIVMWEHLNQRNLLLLNEFLTGMTKSIHLHRGFEDVGMSKCPLYAKAQHIKKLNRMRLTCKLKY